MRTAAIAALAASAVVGLANIPAAQAATSQTTPWLTCVVATKAIEYVRVTVLDSTSGASGIPTAAEITPGGITTAALAVKRIDVTYWTSGSTAKSLRYRDLGTATAKGTFGLTQGSGGYRTEPMYVQATLKSSTGGVFCTTAPYKVA